MWTGDRELWELLSNVDRALRGRGAPSPMTKALERGGFIILKEDLNQPNLWYAELTKHGHKRFHELDAKYA